MPYDYQKERAALMASADIAARMLKVKERIDKAIKPTGAITYDKAMQLTDCNVNWQMAAMLDYLVEHGFYDKIQGRSAAGQDQILVDKTF